MRAVRERAGGTHHTQGHRAKLSIHLRPPRGLPAFSLPANPSSTLTNLVNTKTGSTCPLSRAFRGPSLASPVASQTLCPQPGGTPEPQSHQALPNPAETNHTPVTLYLLFPWPEPPGSLHDQPLGKGFLDVSRPVLLIKGSTKDLPEDGPPRSHPTPVLRQSTHPRFSTNTIKAPTRHLLESPGKPHPTSWTRSSPCLLEKTSEQQSRACEDS